MLRKVIQVVLIGLVFALGLVVGKRYLGGLGAGHDRVGEVLRLIDGYYVDTVDMTKIDDEIIPFLLSKLDPHSVYLSAKLNESESEGLEGSFQGIGIQFNRIKDTVIVSRIISGGGAERAGLKAGDRILRADTASLIGKELTNEDVMSKLKGPGGTVVALQILRDGEPVKASVVRGPVPVSSIDAAYMVSDKLLYVRLNKWGGQTLQEFLTAYAKHRDQGIKGIILDLCDNGGGYLDAPVMLASEFLPRDTKIVYTEGRKFPRQIFTTEKDGLLRDVPLIVLVNEYSASSSEIFAGAMQDHDRAQIVGRRTFGKGLVQRPFVLPDSSVVRLTVARYYTPSGRSIQKSYAEGTEAYARDLYERYEHGELYSRDSIARTADTAIYRTAGGRIVHGGGGITPDVFVPRDSVGINAYYMRLVQSGTLPRFAFDYADKHRKQLSSFATVAELHQHLQSIGQTLLFDYAYYAQSQGVAIRTTLLQRSSELILTQLFALIADSVSADPGAYYEVVNTISPELRKAIELFEAGRWRPSLQPDSVAEGMPDMARLLPSYLSREHHQPTLTACNG